MPYPKDLLRPVDDKLSFDIQPWWEFDVTQVKQLIDAIQEWVDAQQSTIMEVQRGQIAKHHLGSPPCAHEWGEENHGVAKCIKCGKFSA